MKIFFTRQSQIHLDKIYFFYLHKNQKVALNIYNEILDSVESLKDFPNKEPVEPLLEGRANAYRALVVGKLFKIIYFVENETIIVADIWDCRQNPQMHENL